MNPIIAAAVGGDYTAVLARPSSAVTDTIQCYREHGAVLLDFDFHLPTEMIPGILNGLCGTVPSSRLFIVFDEPAAAEEARLWAQRAGKPLRVAIRTPNHPADVHQFLSESQADTVVLTPGPGYHRTLAWLWRKKIPTFVETNDAETLQQVLKDARVGGVYTTDAARLPRRRRRRVPWRYRLGAALEGLRFGLTTAALFVYAALSAPSTISFTAGLVRLDTLPSVLSVFG